MDGKLISGTTTMCDTSGQKSQGIDLSAINKDQQTYKSFLESFLQDQLDKIRNGADQPSDIDPLLLGILQAGESANDVNLLEGIEEHEFDDDPLDLDDDQLLFDEEEQSAGFADAIPYVSHDPAEENPYKYTIEEISERDEDEEYSIHKRTFHERHNRHDKQSSRFSKHFNKFSRDHGNKTNEDASAKEFTLKVNQQEKDSDEDLNFDERSQDSVDKLWNHILHDDCEVDDLSSDDDDNIDKINEDINRRSSSVGSSVMREQQVELEKFKQEEMEKYKEMIEGLISFNFIIDQ